MDTVNNKLVTIKLLGEAGRRFVRQLELDVATVAEAMNALMALFPDFQQYLLEADERGIGWRVIVDDPKGLSNEEVAQDSPIPKQLILAPVIKGKGDVLQIVLGVVLIGVGLIIGLAAPLGLVLFNIGLSFVFSGIARILSPATQRKEAQRRTSFAFTGGNLAAAQGLSVPILYGEAMITRAPVISFGIALDTDA